MKWFPSALFRRARRPHRPQPFRHLYRPLLEQLERRLVPSASPLVNLLTYHNDNFSTGQNLSEVALTPANVNSSSFGKLFTTPVDGQVYAQPLYVAGVNITTGSNPGTHNVVFVATQHDSVYAIDADNGQILWKDSFINPAAGITTVPQGDVISADISPEIGITATPVIDPATNTIYVEAKTKEVRGSDRHYVQKLHAIDITSGAEKFGGPATIADTIWNGGTNYTYVSGPFVFGSGDGNVNGKITFNALRQLVRPGLTLTNGNIIIASASHGDNGPYHGWVLSYSAQNLQLNGVFNATPNLGLGGVWQAGGRVAVDDQGYMYVETGNGPYDATLNSNGFPSGGDYPDSFIKIGVDPTTSPTHQNINGWGLKVVDYFTPFNQNALNLGDTDLASGGILILPDSVGSAAHPHLLIGAGKEGRLYLIDRDNMGKYDPNTDHVVEHATLIHGSLDTPAFFNNTIYYVGGYGDVAKTFTITNGLFSLSPTSQSPDSYSFPGSTPSISANGASNAIVWDLDRGTNQLRAYDASSYANELYTSAQAPNNRDQLGSVVKFTVPSVVNGKVYVGTSNSVVVYGLLQLPTAPPADPSNLLGSAVSGSQINLSWTDNSNNEDGFQIEQSTDGVNFTAIATASANATTFSVVGLQPSTSYSFRVRAFNGVGTSGYTSVAKAQTTNGIDAGLDLSSGFAGAASQLTLNGSAKIVGSLLQLTNGGANQAGSAFSARKLDITNWGTQFSFQLVNPNADGFTFAIQGTAPNALGGWGGGLGFGPDHAGGTGGIPTSLAIKFDLYSNQGESNNSTGLYLNGVAPTSAGSIDLGKSGINLHSGHAFNVVMSYDGAMLTVTITDAVTNASAKQSYAVDIASVVGGPTAYVGFTGGTGGQTSTQNVLNWAYTHPIPPPPGIPANLTATALNGTQVALVWTDTSRNATGFLIERKTGTAGSYSQIAQVGGKLTTFTDTGLNPSTQYVYRVRSTNSSGTSDYCAEASVTPPTPPATASNAHATLDTATEIDLAWQDNADNEDGYKVFRRAGSGDFVPVALLPPNTTSYVNVGLTPNTEYDFHIQAYNVAGFSDFTGLSVMTTQAGPPPAAPTNFSVVADYGQVALQWNASPGAASYNLYRGTASGGEGSSPIQAGLTTPFLIDSGLAQGTTYFYRVTANGAGGESTPSVEVAATTPKPALDFSGGFATAVGALTANGSAKISGSMLQLTDGRPTEAGSVFSTAKVGVARFTTQFSFQLINPNADGFTFTIQGIAPNAIGPLGGGLGYGPQQAGGTGGIANSVAIKFDLFSNQGESNNSTGLYTNGAAPTTPGSIDLGSSGINLHSGHVFNAAMAYDGTVLRVTITDAVTGASASQSYTTNIPSLVGGSTAYVGFTAGSGGQTAVQNILNWTYTPALVSPPPPANLNATAGVGQVSLSWTAPSGATSYNIYRTGATGSDDGPIQTGVTGTSFTDTGLDSEASYTYQVTAVGVGGESGSSNPASATTLIPNYDFSGGFVANGSLTLNGSAKINGSSLQLTTGGANQAGSAFTSTLLGVTRFTTQFSFQLINPNADGFTFAIQGGTPTALGPSGGGLGYGPQQAGGTGGIANSVAIKFDLYSNQGESNNSTGLYTNGAAPTTPGSISLGNLNLHSGHVFGVAIAYDGTTLKVTITDTVTGASASQSYAIDIPGTVGSSTAYVGFTGGTGGQTATQNILNWTYATGLVTPPAPSRVTATAGLGQMSLSWAASAGASSYNVYRSTSSNGEGGTPLQAGITGTSFTDNAVTRGTPYYYQVTAVGIAGEGLRSTEASATPPQPSLDFSSGFASAAGQLTVNGSAKLNGSFLQLTNGGASQSGSAFTKSPLDITRFTTQFSFQLPNANADGFTFCIQGASSTALGLMGGGLGYGPQQTGSTGGIINSVAVKFDLYSNQGESNNSTGLYTNGAAPTTPGSIDLGSGGINLHSGHVFNVAMTYDGATLKVTITDAVTGASASQSYTVNIPTLVGGSAAYVGFTGGTGGLTADQRILSWLFVSKPAAPAGLAAVGGNGQVALTWSSSPGAATYNIYRSTTPGGEGVTVLQNGVTSTSFADTGVANGTNYYYQVTAVNFLGESIRSNEASASPALLNFSQGFAAATSSLSLNGSANLNGSTLQLTSGGTLQAASAFASSQVSVSRFATQFNFQVQDTTNPGADGFAFVIQGSGPTALGVVGGGLGYANDPFTPGVGIPNSVAVKFDLFDNDGEGNDSTGLYTNGAAPTSAGSIDLTPTAIDLHSGHVFNVAMTYDGATLQVIITDTVTHASATQSYVVDIPAVVGSNMAYVGFTAGTGGLTADQRILGWSFSPM
jgi:fibronectin type 3 domain-containing protein